jgi:4,5-dihydroxyphthalate decarboxylase
MAREDAMDLGFPALRYDITLPLADGRVGIDGVTLRPAKISSMVFKDVPEMREGRFGLAELNLGYLCAAVEAGWKFVALPVFAKHKGPLGFIFCRKSAGIAAPRDLEGKRIGTRQYRTALTLWARGWLAEHYGVDTAKLRWTAQVPEVFPFAGTPPAIDYVPPEPGIVERFLAGETDVLITDISDAAAFDRLESDSGVHRLFADYAEEEARVVATAGYYAPVHVMILSRALDEADPSLARRIFDAFVRAKQMARDDVLSDRAGFAIAWLRDAVKAEEARFGDLWPYGISANRKAVDALIRYNVADGAIRAALPLERIFAKGTLET